MSNAVIVSYIFIYNLEMIFGPVLSNILFFIFGVIKPAFGCIKSLEEDYSQNLQQWLTFCVIAVPILQLMNIIKFAIVFYDDIRLLLVIALGWDDARGAHILYSLFIRPKIQKFIILTIEGYQIIKQYDIEELLTQKKNNEDLVRYSTVWEAFKQWKMSVGKKNH